MKDVLVIGGGVAGLQAGIFTAKAGEGTMVLDTGESLVQSTSAIQNLLGFDTVAGNALLENGRQKLEDFGGEFRREKATRVERREDGFEVETGEGTYRARYIVVATAGNHDFLEPLDLEFEDGRDAPYMIERHLVTDSANRAAEKVYAAGLANSWEYQTSIAMGDGAKAAVNLLTDKHGEPYTDHDT